MGKASGGRDGCVFIMDVLADEALPLLVLVRALGHMKPESTQPEIYDVDHELFSHPLDALRYLLVNLPGVVSGWDPGAPMPGITSGLWRRMR